VVHLTVALFQNQNNSVSLRIAQFDVDLRARPRALDVATRLVATALRDDDGVEEIPAVRLFLKEKTIFLNFFSFFFFLS
jgi:hypothetical protein